MKKNKKQEKLDNIICCSQPINHVSIPISIISNQVNYIREIIQNTILSIQEYNKDELFSNSDTNQCIQTLHDLYERSKDILSNSTQNSDSLTSIPIVNPATNDTQFKDNCMNKLQNVVDDLTNIISKFGTKYTKDLLYLCFGSDFQENIHIYPLLLQKKMEILNNHTHPLGFKTTRTRSNTESSLIPPVTTELCMNKDTDDTIIIEHASSLECFDVKITDNFYERVHKIKYIIHNEKTNKMVIIHAIIDNINLSTFSNQYIEERVKNIIEKSKNKTHIDGLLLKRQIESMTLKNIMVSSDDDILKKNNHIQNFVKNIKTMKLEDITKNFVNLDLFSKRSQLIDMLLYIEDHEIQYLAYLLYDLLSNVDTKNDDFYDSKEQIIIHKSLPWKLRCYFKDAMKNTIQYNHNVINKYENTSVSIEQQIIFWRVSENIKERAFIKLKEFKGRMDESGSKAKQYLEGLLRIPFDNYRSEPLLKITENINTIFLRNIQTMNCDSMILHKKEKYTNFEIQEYYRKMNQLNHENMSIILNSFHLKDLQAIFKIYSNNNNKLKSKDDIVQKIQEYIISSSCNEMLNQYLIQNIRESDFEGSKITKKMSELQFNLLKQLKYRKDTVELSQEISTTTSMIRQIRDTLDASIHGHSYAKQQIMKIICQWMNGSTSGYCFGFEGSPGIGKTSLAKKGLSKCLVDDEGTYRPFSFIALGGSCNGSTLEGHSYTYLNSTWGRITDILMESKCMNPIIYIDELDKVSKSEHGKEIIGILTHLIDSTQNDGFQDKFFGGIPLDLSKALFIFSYNDAEQIDKILLDRIHRIKFENLSLNEKIVITTKYLLPEINEKMGFHDTVIIENNIIQHIIENYTCEPGVRKLKEIIFDMYGAINIELLENCSSEFTLEKIPIRITLSHLDKYLKKYKKIQDTKIHNKHMVGIMNGLWANSMGRGGIIPIEAMFFPTENFLELKLTGLQGDVMKESMNVAKTLVWSLCTTKQKDKIINNVKHAKTQGIHVHCPEGAISKDGPSAGTAIVMAIYSLLNNIPIRNDIGITGEICLQGNVSAIGGLDSKITGGIKAGIKTFIIPSENNADFKKNIQQMIDHGYILDNKHVTYHENKCEILYENKTILFISVSNIQEVLQYVFETKK